MAPVFLDHSWYFTRKRNLYQYFGFVIAQKSDLTNDSPAIVLLKNFLCF